MIKTVYCGLTPVIFNSQQPLGSGAEGTVYTAVYETIKRALKIFNEIDKRAIDKLTSLMGIKLPPAVVAPIRLVYDLPASSKDRKVVGYLMALVEGSPLPLIDPNAPAAEIVMMLKRLCKLYASLSLTLAESHRVGVVFGDVKRANIIVNDKDVPHIIDNDGVGFDRFTCDISTPENDDPCQPKDLDKLNPEQYKQAMKAQDRYALSAMLIKSIHRCTSPYSGTCRDTKGASMGESERIRLRLSVFNDSVTVNGLPTKIWPEAIYQFLKDSVEGRGGKPFPHKLFENIVWTICKCGQVHGDRKCFNCGVEVQVKEIAKPTRMVQTVVFQAGSVYANQQGIRAVAKVRVDGVWREVILLPIRSFIPILKKKYSVMFTLPGNGSKFAFAWPQDRGLSSAEVLPFEKIALVEIRFNYLYKDLFPQAREPMSGTAICACHDWEEKTGKPPALNITYMVTLALLPDGRLLAKPVPNDVLADPVKRRSFLQEEYANHLAEIARYTTI